MVLLVKIQEASIVENLKKRYLDDLIYVSSSIFMLSVVMHVHIKKDAVACSACIAYCYATV